MSLINRMLLELDARQGVYRGAHHDVINHLKPVAETPAPDRKKQATAVLLVMTAVAASLFITVRHEDALTTTGAEIRPQSTPITAAAAGQPTTPGTAADSLQPAVMAGKITINNPPDTASPVNRQITQAAEQMTQTVAVAANTTTAPAPTADEGIRTDSAAALETGRPESEPATYLSVTRSEADDSHSGTRQTEMARPSERFAAAMHFYKQGQMDKCIDLLYETVMLEADNSDAREFLAGLLLQQQKWQEAEQLLTTGLQRTPDNIALNRLLARLKIEQGQDDLAIALLENPAVQQQVDARSAALLGLLYQRRQRYQDSADYYRLALRQQPTQGKWWLGLAITLEAIRDHQGASKAYRLAAESPDLDTSLRLYARQRRELIGAIADPTQNSTSGASKPSATNKIDNHPAVSTTPDTTIPLSLSASS